MTSSYLHRKCTDGRPRSSATTPCRFLRVILDDTSRDRKLGLPESFLDKYRNDLSNRVYFELPCGSEWEIGLTRYNGVVWFRKNWPELSKFYSLEKGDSLVFGYEGNSRFQVSIFDRSNNMEIDYTTRMPKSEGTDEDDDDISLEILEDVRPSVLPHKKNRAVLSPKAETNVNVEKCVIKKETHWSKSKKKTGTDNFPAKKDGEGTSSTQRFQKQTPGVLRRAKSCNHSFRVVMDSSYITQKFLWLPKKFVQTHLLKQPSNAMLQVSDARQIWPVKLIYEEKKGRVQFQSGWSEFVRDKDLKEGDVCEFVLIDGIRLLFEVMIETANCSSSPDIDDGDDEDDEDENEDDTDDDSIEILDHFPPHPKRKEKSPLTSRIHKRMKSSSRAQKFHEGRPEVPRRMHHTVTESTGKSRALQRANAFKCANPHFTVPLHSSYIHAHYLYLPSKFAKRYLIKQPSHAILRVSSERTRTWSVKFHYVATRTTFQSGWLEFVQGNDLKTGDACIFMLTDNIKFLFDVVFFRAT